MPTNKTVNRSGYISGGLTAKLIETLAVIQSRNEWPAAPLTLAFCGLTDPHMTTVYIDRGVPATKGCVTAAAKTEFRTHGETGNAKRT